MSRSPEDNSIYTLQRRLGTQRRGEVADTDVTSAEPVPAGENRAERRSFMLGRLFAWRVRAA